jgi:light-regulated signal transduction histidine kinase (bacteriophytochrome)
MELLAMQKVDCILLDMIMPGLGGQETCRRIKSTTAWRDIPLILHTAKDERGSMIAGINAGADDYIAKSDEFEVLRARLRAQLRRKQFEDENRSIREQLLHKELEAAEANAARELAEIRAKLLSDLKEVNTELESFSYSVAHDLRAPLRSIDGFCQALLEDYEPNLDETGKKYLHFVRDAAQHMALLIDDLLTLSRVTRSELVQEAIDLSALARASVARLERSYPERKVNITIQEGLKAAGDARLLSVVFDNLFGNAWKFTGKRQDPRVEFGATVQGAHSTYYVRDNGAGFDMAFTGKLFGVFQRLHSTAEFEGTGIGLATVQRILRRHSGRVWAEGAVDAGATIFFTLGDDPKNGSS